MAQAVLHQEVITVSQKLHFAIELSSSKWLLAFSSGGACAPKIRTIDAADLPALLDAVAKVRRSLKLPEGAVVVSCYEAGRDGFWLDRWLAEQGVKNVVVEPATVGRGRSRGRSPKTDKLDAKALVQMLVRFERGERDVWRTLRVPAVDDEDERRLPRHRQVLLRERCQHANRISSLLLTVGVRIAHAGRVTEEHIDALVGWDGKPLPAELAYQLRLEVRRLALVRAQLSEVEKKLKATAEADPLSRALMALKGVGVRSARILSTEFFGWRQFRNAREVGALAGLTGTPFCSGLMNRELGISKAGNRRVRSTAIELAWFWLRHQPGSALSLWFHRYVGEKPSSRQKRRGIVALARKLLVTLWRYTKDAVLPIGAELKAA